MANVEGCPRRGVSSSMKSAARDSIARPLNRASRSVFHLKPVSGSSPLWSFARAKGAVAAGPAKSMERRLGGKTVRARRESIITASPALANARSTIAVWPFGRLAVWPFGRLAVWPFGL